jgi:hypothetical protein
MVARSLVDCLTTQRRPSSPRTRKTLRANEVVSVAVQYIDLQEIEQKGCRARARLELGEQSLHPNHDTDVKEAEYSTCPGHLPNLIGQYLLRSEVSAHAVLPI